MCFLPLPLHPVSAAQGLFADIPDQVPLLPRLPISIRRALVRAIPGPLKGRLGAYAQTRISEAIMECGWQGPQPRSIMEMLKADLTIVNDFPDFYSECVIPPDLAITGPLFAAHRSATELDPAIRRAFDPADPAPKLFCTMGSSGSKQALLTAVRALAQRADDPWNAVILVPPGPMPARRGDSPRGFPPGIVVTDAFVPAPAVNALADVTICHGGQGTIRPPSPARPPSSAWPCKSSNRSTWTMWRSPGLGSGFSGTAGPRTPSGRR